MRIVKILMAALALLTTFNTRASDKKVVIVTGSASGIGKATCERLLKEGYIVYGGDIELEKNQYLDKTGGHSLILDVTKDDQVKAAVDRVIKEQGKIDILFNNAGFGVMGTNEETTMEDAQKVMDVNFYGYVRMIKAVLPQMRAQKSGRIINTTSMGGKIYFPLAGIYHASKHALEGWLDVLRLEVKEFGIKVVIIEPGFINTNFYNVSGDYGKKYGANTAYGHIFEPIAKAPLPKMSEPDVIAKVVAKAITKRNPKTRYVKGKSAKMLIWMRNTLGDKMYDRIVMSQLK
ncbi:NAD(P)-dependent dehydrogenase (short-subunit alcohol dehydrogenase family) [Dyadobacter sp. BE34]|uniref:NAD(P)-dependent dehydrogenase (Short-subunit alcohol dehydrogenase family) n=1 Tax=Dyadobacter fermentans TaxID=94254 RepID=A0ABU1QTW4_9BACT|nr:MULTISPECIES: oxidoreductase [Dyadobacter]MDR6804600.1 NAD(P)-dependent dehydrogenase (short-subunit alcohol dehydrogenase family) [Dyadobacter fermentans]MDR7043641.1 NAD(P)-dependent dehydrogenase (short-subunit alcohol dehydrogenase family) [Dyadobacter sp. BE242]MDR7197953.1 NAD(P)-dependent dehydrogenase (short-subunit alcohol dehydrogenase family) [Dyadobacter sp. BE34]MDR7214614.1 NAD(P)-dependent dehydrogenase (short-subunit alcohol dehydrogenase family) [Dyadobacter sp. BE31]MDR726